MRDCLTFGAWDKYRSFAFSFPSIWVFQTEGVVSMQQRLVSIQMSQRFFDGLLPNNFESTNTKPVIAHLRELVCGDEVFHKVGFQLLCIQRSRVLWEM